MQIGDYVVVRASNEIGQIEAVNNTTITVLARGVHKDYHESELVVLTEQQLRLFNGVMKLIAETIDRYHDDDVYDPVYNEEGQIIYSSAAAAVFRSLSFASLIFELDKLTGFTERIEEDD